jgi:hypothetical protein
MPLEFDGNRRVHLAKLLLLALRAHGDRLVVEGLVFGEIVTAILATIMISRQRGSSTHIMF